MTVVSREPHALQPAPSVRRILIVDLNNFATFPTLAIGLLVAALRKDGHEVDVLCPLAHGVSAIPRESADSLVDHAKRRVHLSTSPMFRSARDAVRGVRRRYHERPQRMVLREVTRALGRRPDIVLLSAYLRHFRTVSKIGELAKKDGVPVLVGGPMFNFADTAAAWSSLPGVVGVVGTEADLNIGRIVDAICEKSGIDHLPGITMPDGSRAVAPTPLRQLDRTPIADFSDFPWDRYPVRIVPLMTGRGCQWDKCLFCSDVISVSGRTFRTRSVENVLLEMQEQSRRHDTRNFLFLDLKLNSYPPMMRGIASGIQDLVPGAEWIGTVHVDLRKDNGLSREDLELAVGSGMRRVSFGLETGSQRMLDLMQKGSSVEANSEFVRHAHDVDLSVRCTMFQGFPGETAADMEATAEFLEKHSTFLDRVRFNDFTLLLDTPIYKAVKNDEESAPAKLRDNVIHRVAGGYQNPEGSSLSYRRAKARALRAVFEINRRPLRPAARQFDGLM